jgi:type I restriction enzyme S subunit
LQNVFENKGSNWEEAKWKEILDIRSGRNQKAVLDAKGDYPILGSAGKVMGYANSYLCEANTTIIGRKGTINNPLFITTKFWNVDTAFGLHAGEKLTSKFLYYFCKSFDFTEMDKGSGRPSLVKTDLLQIKMSFPSISEQEQIIYKIDAFHSETKKLEVIYKQKIADLEEMKKSVLQKAFSGQLNAIN